MTLDFEMKSDALYFVSLGGCGSFGSNMNMYGYNGKWIMVDCGMGFAGVNTPGVEIILPDPKFAMSLGDDLLGVIITHAHEDHIGGIKHLWSQFKTPIYATKLNINRIKQAVSEQPWGDKTMLQEVPLEGDINLGPFNVQFINMAHSIPESSALAISVKDVGTIIHTGDWKLDANPIEGNVTNETLLKKIGDTDVMAVVSNSTNATVKGHSGSEIKVKDSLTKFFGELKGAIAVTCFSTSVARIHSVAKAAEANGRAVCLIGLSLKRMNEVARNSGYLQGLNPFIDEDQALSVKPDKLVYLCTGSQGEPRAALSRIANGEHKNIKLGPNSTVIFSARKIPCNEADIDRVQNKLRALGVNVVTNKERFVHVSGHPCEDELKEFYNWVRPKKVITVHGEYEHQEKHAKLAKEECGISETFIPNNGEVLEIASSREIKIVETAVSGVLAVEGNRLVPIDHEAIAMRKRIMYNGSAVVTVVIDAKGNLLAEPQITAMGLIDETSEADSEYTEGAIEEVKSFISDMSKSDRLNEGYMRENIRLTVRRYLKSKFDRKPQVRVHLVRI